MLDRPQMGGRLQCAETRKVVGCHNPRNSSHCEPEVANSVFCRSLVKPRHSALIVTLAGNRCRPRVASSGHLSDGGIHHGVNAEYAAKYDRLPR